MALCVDCRCSLVQGTPPYFELIHDNTAAAEELHCCVCVECFGLLHAKRGCQPFFQCPACGIQVVGHRCWTKTITSLRQKNNKLTKDVQRQQPVYIKKPSMLGDPCRFFQAQDESYRSDNLLLSVQWRMQDETRSLVIPVLFREPCDSYDEDIQKKLVSFMSLLYHVFFHPDTAEGQSNIVLQSPDDIEDFVLNDRSLLLQAIIALGTGASVPEILPKGVDSNPFQRNSFLAFWAAIEMVRRGKSLKPGVLQDVISHHLMVHKCPQAVGDFLTRFRISASRERKRLKDIEAVNNLITEGWKLKGKQLCVPFVMYDNLGFRVLGARAGYDQYTMIVVHFVSVEELCRAGFYSPSGMPSISRQRHVWSEERVHYAKENILPTTDDYTALGIQVLSQIDALLLVVNSIPSLEVATSLIEDGGTFVADARIATSYGTTTRATSCRNDTAEVEVEEVEDNEEECEEGVRMQDPCLSNPTMYERKDQEISVDVPMRKADLNKRETVLGLALGALDLRDRVLASTDLSGIETDEDPLLADVGIFSGGDGSPSNMFDTMNAEDPERFNMVKNFNGGFHQLLNFLNSVGKRFADTHLREFLHPFRDTDKKKDWFLFPGDPNQTLTELPEMTAPHYVAAIRELTKLHGGQASLSAVNVHDYMLERAILYDDCMIILQWLHFVEVGNIMRDSEKENDPELYRTGARLAMLLYVKTHASKYVRMGVCYWIWWQCTSSDADKKLYDSFFFTKKTSDGRSIWSDRFVEWFNKDIRTYLGKYAKPNQQLLLTRTTLLMKERKRWKASETASRRANRSAQEYDGELIDKSLAISPIFCHQLIMIDMWNIWGSGPLLVGSKGATEEATCFSDRLGKNALNVALLFDITAAEKRLMDYFEYNHLQEEADRVERSEMGDGISLHATPTRVSDVAESRADEVARQTATSRAKLVKLCTVPYMKERIVMLRNNYQYLQECCTVPLPRDKPRKLDWAIALADHHGAIRQRDASFVKTVTDDVKSRSLPCEGNADTRAKLAELKHPFYALTDAAKNIFFEEKHDVEVAMGHGEPQPDDGVADTTSTTPTRTPARRRGTVVPDTPGLMDDAMRNLNLNDGEL